MPAAFDLSLSVLLIIERMSIRTYNVCGQNGLLTLHAILQYYDQHGTFLQLPKAGAKIEAELMAVCLKFRMANLESSLNDSQKFYQDHRHVMRPCCVT